MSAIIHGDCREVMRAMEAERFHAIATDPPYGLSFMGKGWDRGVPGVEFWSEALRVAKPGAHLVAFGGTRTYHRLACAIEDAGWEIRDSLMWIYGSGFPKSLDVSKAIDKARNDDVRPVCRFLRGAMEQRGLVSRDLAPLFACHPRLIDHWAARDTDSQPSCPTPEQWLLLKAHLGLDDSMDGEVARLNERKGDFGEAWLQREVTGVVEQWTDRANYALTSADGLRRDLASSEAAIDWSGFGTALKPAFEPIILARKPLIGTVAQNVLEHGCGAINVDGCRIATSENLNGGAYAAVRTSRAFEPDGEGRRRCTASGDFVQPSGRWPANVILGCACEVEHDPGCAVAMLDAQSGESLSSGGSGHAATGMFLGAHVVNGRNAGGLGDTGGASRFFYVAKATREERERWLRAADDGGRANKHPTVKPVALMRWLVRLVGGKRGSLVLDPFCGSGTTAVACALEGFDCNGIELDAESVETARGRLLGAIEESGAATSDHAARAETAHRPVQLGLLGEPAQADLFGAAS